MIGEEGKMNEVDRIIEIKMYDNYYIPTEIKIKKNETSGDQGSKLVKCFACSRLSTNATHSLQQVKKNLAPQKLFRPVCACGNQCE